MKKKTAGERIFLFIPPNRGIVSTFKTLCRFKVHTFKQTHIHEQPHLDQLHVDHINIRPLHKPWRLTLYIDDYVDDMKSEISAKKDALEQFNKYDLMQPPTQEY